MQISGVSLALTWPHRLCLLRVLLCTSHCYNFPLSKHTGGGDTASAFMWEVGLFPLSCGVFLPPLLLQVFPLLVAGHVPPFLPSPAWLVYLRFCEGFPSSPLRCSVHPTLFAMCLYCSYCLLLSFSFYPGWGSVCPGGYADLAQGCLWEYNIPLSSPCGPHLPKPSGH
jgi:hypothetical protein